MVPLVIALSITNVNVFPFVDVLLIDALTESIVTVNNVVFIVPEPNVLVAKMSIFPCEFTVKLPDTSKVGIVPIVKSLTINSFESINLVSFEAEYFNATSERLVVFDNPFCKSKSNFALFSDDLTEEITSLPSPS